MMATENSERPRFDRLACGRAIRSGCRALLLSFRSVCPRPGRLGDPQCGWWGNPPSFDLGTKVEWNVVNAPPLSEFLASSKQENRSRSDAGYSSFWLAVHREAFFLREQHVAVRREVSSTSDTYSNSPIISF